MGRREDEVWAPLDDWIEKLARACQGGVMWTMEEIVHVLDASRAFPDGAERWPPGNKGQLVRRAASNQRWRGAGVLIGVNAKTGRVSLSGLTTARKAAKKGRG